MKVVFLADDFPPYNPGGAGVVAFNLAQALQKQGCQVCVISTRQDRNVAERTDYGGLEIFRVYSNYHPRWWAYSGLFNPRTLPKVKRILEGIKPDVVHAHNIHRHLSYDCLRLARRYSRRVFLTAHDAMLVHYGKWLQENPDDFKIGLWDQIKTAKKRYNPLRNIIIRRYLANVDKVFAISDALKNVLEANGIKNMETIYDGIDVDLWQEDTGATERFRRKHNLLDKKPIFFSGRLSEAKGGKAVLEVLSCVLKKIPEAVLLVAGREDIRVRKMMALAGRLGIDDNVIFTGWLEREGMKSAYFAAEVVVNLSVYLDPFNLTNIEAMASGKPVVGTCFGGTKEIVLDGETGYIVDPRDAAPVAAKVCHLLGNPARAKQFGQAGYLRVEKKFSLRQQVEATLKWYNTCY